MAIINEQEDAPAGSGTPYAMAVGDRFRGMLAEESDEDGVRIELEAGQTYTITLGGIGPGPVADTVLRVYDARARQVAVNDDVDVGAGQFHSRVEFTPDTSGVYYLSAGGYSGNPTRPGTGRYELRVYEAEDFEGRTLTGTEGNDVFLDEMAGGPGDDELNGRGGDDVLDGGPGADVLAGGPGNDTAWYGYSGSGVRVSLDTGAARGGDAEGDTLSGIERLSGSAHADRLTGNRLANTLAGHDGHDTLNGRGGNDRLLGGAGDDRLDGQGGNDWLAGGAGADRLKGGEGFDAVSYADSPAGVTVRLYDGTAEGGDAEGDTFPGRKTIVWTAGAGRLLRVEVPDIEYLDGSEYDDYLAGERGNDRLEGRGGNDTLEGRQGDDRLEGEAGADILLGGPGEDTASYRYSDAGVIVRLHDGTAKGGHAGGDTFPGTETVMVTGEDGVTRQADVPDVEHLHGSRYDDVLAGDVRDNRLDGGPGDDALYGGPEGGDDALYGNTGNDRLYGGKGDDRLYGGQHADVLRGGPGEDTLGGGSGNDILAGGPGDDTLNGGAGADTFVLAPGGGNDTLLDFGNGSDRLDLSAFEDIDSLDDLTLQQQESDLVIDLTAHDGGMITLAGVNESDLADTHVVFFSDDA